MENNFGAALEPVIFQQSFVQAPNCRSREPLQGIGIPPLAHLLSDFGAVLSFQERSKARVFFSPYSHFGNLVAAWESINPALISKYLEQSPSEPVADSLNKVGKHYIIIGGKKQVTHLFTVHRGLPKLLLDAVQPLRESFGERLLQLQANSDGDDVSLTATIQWSDNAELARAALNDFDQRWWLNNCKRAHGYLTFDYELVDGL